MKIYTKLCILYLIIHLILISSIQVSKAKEFLLPERVNFNPGQICELENVDNNLRRQNGSVILDQKQSQLNILVPLKQYNATYALICRSCSMKQDTFNLIEVTANGKWIGNYYPCTEMFTNKKMLFEGIGNNVEIKMKLKEGSGCLVDHLRIYAAEEAYKIKELANTESKLAGHMAYFHPDDVFRKRALMSAKWLEGKANVNGLSLRLLLKRTAASWGKDRETFKMMIRRYIEYLETPDLQIRHPLWCTAFGTFDLLNKWKKIENDNNFSFSNVWRLEIINALYYMARISFIDWSAYRLNRHYRKYRYLFPDEWQKLKIYNYPYQFRREQEIFTLIPRCKEFDKRHPFVPHNHMTRPALSLLYAARYFEQYKVPEINVWQDISRWTFTPLMNSFKPMEDCYSYQLGAMKLASKYALFEDKKEFFNKGGPLWRFLDLQIISTNNKGDGVCYGDVSRYGKCGFNSYIDKIFIFNSLINNSPIPMPDSFNNLLKEKAPEDYTGLHVHPLEKLFYKQYKDLKGGPAIVEDERFDKISFREGWGKNDQYLLLDGISVGFHGHQDGNAILEFSEKNRTWLIDMGYTQDGIRRACSHNMVTISRPEVNEGEESPVEKTPPFCAIVDKADLPSAAFTSTILRDYNGTDWTRNIIWKKGMYFAVFDEVINTKGTRCKATCRWRTLGDVNSISNKFVVAQRPKREVLVGDRRELTFNIHQLDSSQAMVRDGVDNPEHWKDYPYAEPIVRVIEETWQFESNLPNEHVFINLFYVAGKKIKNITASSIDRTSIKMLNDDSKEIIGINGIETEEGLKTDAELFIIGKDHIALCNATFLFIHGKKIFQRKEPVSLSFDFNISEGTLAPKKPTRFKVLSNDG